ncbi:hypothetical protein MPTA5024_26390 [Microbispora sp. ATCC PTA-5024]|nr:hypothetical protein MPTA5024_26390 [Microbispora sp. ATCC PTA-5024]
MTLDRVRCSGVDFSGLHFDEFSSFASEFDGCDFSETTFGTFSGGASGVGGTLFSGQTWPQSVYRNCVFRRTRFPQPVFLGNVRFEKCVFDRSRLRGMTWTQEAEFVGCTFLGRVREVNFWGLPVLHQWPPFEKVPLGRGRNEFTGNDFSRAEVEWVAFKHIDLDAQKWPGLPDHALLDRISERVPAVLKLVGSWPDTPHRKQAWSNLEFLAAGTREHGVDDKALVHRLVIGNRLPPELRDEVFKALGDDHRLIQQ